MQALPVFTFANQAGLDMLETTLVALQDITLEKIFDEQGRKTLFSELPQIMQQVSTSKNSIQDEFKEDLCSHPPTLFENSVFYA